MRRSLVLLLSLLVARSAFAWGDEGHRVVCEIAFLSLNETERAEVTRLTNAYRLPPRAQLRIHSFPDACALADEARSRALSGAAGWERFASFKNFHFLNLPRTERRVDERFCANDCVLEGLRQESAALRNATGDQEKAEALFFLAHFAADVHQPLHVSYRDDHGGSEIEPIGGGFYFSKNLHSVWDSGILRRSMGSIGWRAYARLLRDRIAASHAATWRTANPLQWAQESYDITTRPDVEYCVFANGRCKARSNRSRTLRSGYQSSFHDDVDLRLQQAGVRLAELIRNNL